MNAYTILSSTSETTTQWGTYHAPTAADALEAARRDLASLYAHSLVCDAALFGRVVTPAEKPHLWIDGHEE